jgi:DeoR family transcriptional regulator, aga operon transcriptional repressor
MIKIMVNPAGLSSLERQERIAAFLDAHARASIDQLVAEFGVSPATVRRDLEALAAQGLVQRVHGGVRSLIGQKQVAQERPALERECEQGDEKRRIGAAAAALVQDGETVFIGSGTTALEAARALRNCKRLTVITNSLMVINALADLPHIDVIALGGQLRRSEMSLIGHTAEHALADLRADKVIMGIRAIDPQVGLTNAYLPETMTDRAILKIGREIVLLADHTKFGRVAPAFVAPFTAIHTLVTDLGTPASYIDAASARGIRVMSV